MSPRRTSAHQQHRFLKIRPFSMDEKGLRCTQTINNRMQLSANLVSAKKKKSCVFQFPRINSHYEALCGMLFENINIQND